MVVMKGAVFLCEQAANTYCKVVMKGAVFLCEQAGQLCGIWCPCPGLAGP
jgi:hypothetical protein